MSEQETEFVELKLSVKVPKPIYDFLKDFYALNGETVEEVLATDTENMVVFNTLDEIKGMNRKHGIIEKYGLKELMEKKDC